MLSASDQWDTGTKHGQTAVYSISMYCHGFSSSDSLTPKASPQLRRIKSDRHEYAAYNTKRIAIMSMSLRLAGKSVDDDGFEGSSPPGLPALGPAGTSSLGDDSGTNVSEDPALDYMHVSTSATEDNNDSNKVPTFVNPKFALQYTCNVCETKNRVIVSRKAYREGMVIALCKGCDNKHWIADNLDPTLQQNNIEDYMESIGLGDTVNRVTKEVYEIERVWGLKEGVLTDDSGNAVLE